jgi:CubicO group peptidase (beta-lactamase class C family)
MKRLDGWPVAAMALAACLSGSPQASATDDVTTRAASTAQEDIWQRTTSGIAYIVPAGWTVQSTTPAIVMAPSDADAAMMIADVTASTPDEAVAAAWNRYRPGHTPVLIDAGEREVRNGWSQVRSYRYQASDRFVRAQVMHEGDSWVVVIMDLPHTVMNRREAQVTRLLSSLRARNFVPPTLAGKTANALDARRIDTLVAFLDDARRRLAVPGLALALVQNGEVKFAGGLGVRSLGSEARVDASTLFLTASITKPLTSLLLARLVDTGELQWDAPARSLLPGFKVGSRNLTDNLQVRHLLCACSGIPAQDMESTFSGDEMDADDVLAILGRVEPTAGIGELYQYSNLMAAAAGYLGGHLVDPDLPLEKAYDAAMQQHVFDPLGMSSTTFDIDAAQKGNHAAPHATTVDGDTVIASMDINRMSLPMRPDGGAWSNVNDLSRYLLMELSGGLRPDGSRFIGREALIERQKGQVARGGLDQWYGMGLKIDRRVGIQQVLHGGSMAGYQGEIYWLPDHDVGFAVLMNANAGVHIRGLLIDRLLELLFDTDLRAQAQLDALPAQLAAGQREHRKALELPVGSDVLDQLASRYSHPVLGTIDVVRDGTTTWFYFGGWKTEVASTKSDGAITIQTISPAVDWLTFAVAREQGKRSLILNDGQRSYAFHASEKPED